MATPTLSLCKNLLRFSPNLSRIQARTFLSDAFRCRDAWDKRLESSLLRKIKMDDYYYELDQKLNSERRASAVDIDLFANNVTQPSQLDDLEDLLHRFRRSPNTAYMLPSTPHATIRSYLQLSQDPSDITRILDDRANYGLFADHFCSCLMMDQFLTSGDSCSAAKVAIQMMLQEDFGPPLAASLALYACHKHIRTDKPYWDVPPPEEDTTEEVKVRVRFVRNPFFDDHFDLRDPTHLLGKTLAFAGMGRTDQIGLSSQLLGWGMYQKWDKVRAVLEKHPELDKFGLEMLTTELETADNPDALICQELIRDVRTSADMLQTLQSEVESITAKYESSMGQSQVQLYDQWDKRRWAELKRQVAQFKREERLRAVADMKQEMAEKEEVLFFFQNKDKLELQLEEDEKVLAELRKNLPKHIQLQAEAEEEYIPPDVR